MKGIFAGVMTILSIVWLIILIKGEINRYYDYQENYNSYWELADKSSTIEEKSNYINKFVIALEKSGCQGQYNAILYPTPTNSFDYNLKALKSLQQRLEEIKTMDIRSFEYQTAIQQITGQEQGEASSMLNELEGTWMKNNYFFFWGWVGALNWILLIIFIIITGAVIGSWLEDN